VMAPSGFAIDEKIAAAVAADVAERHRRKRLALAGRHNVRPPDVSASIRRS
jgi:hypothetical protein